ncbi:MAG: replication-relaxation family protein [Planctomycetaceae bacterium]|nr:replication-relaxation family protein [Planctomycetaceae bacterium]
MPKRFNTKIGVRDLEILSALDRTPLTAAQLCLLSSTFSAPFQDVHNLRRRLRRLTESGLLRSWPYALINDGRSPRYFRLTRDGFRLLHGVDAKLPNRRYFEEIRHGHHFHTHAMADVVIHLNLCGHRHGIRMAHFARENSVRFQTAGFTLYPDCAFQLVRADGRVFHFVVEIDNGTERVQTKLDVESIERKLRGYDAHNAQFDAHDPERYLVLFITTRSKHRVDNILRAVTAVTQQPGRTVFLATDMKTLQQSDPFEVPVFSDHRGLKRTLLPRFKDPLNSKENIQQHDESVLPCGPAGRPFSGVSVRP